MLELAHEQVASTQRRTPLDRSIGPDAHASSCTLGVGASERRLGSQVVEANAQALAAAIRVVPGTQHLCLEEGMSSGWLHEVRTELDAGELLEVVLKAMPYAFAPRIGILRSRRLVPDNRRCSGPKRGELAFAETRLGNEPETASSDPLPCGRAR
jgi:hypothetical protein